MKKLPILFLLFAGSAYAGKTIDPPKGPLQTALKEQAQQWMQNQPVQFLENKGQMVNAKGNPVPYVLFKATVPGMDMYVTESGLTYVFMKIEEEREGEDISPDLDKRKEAGFAETEFFKTQWERVDMDLKGAIISKENIIKETPLVTDFNYFFPHCSEGIYGVKEYEKITIKDIYPGIDWVLYNSTGKGYKYDFIVRPGADPDQIKLVYSSLNPLQLTKDGAIEIKTELGVMNEQAPYSFVQETGKKVESRYKITSQNKLDNCYQTTIGFEFFPKGQASANLLRKESSGQTLVIDPELVWATFYGGTGTEGPMSVDCDLAGNVFITGYCPPGLPVFDPAAGAYYQGTMLGFSDAFIVKFSNSGVRLWATYYGGPSGQPLGWGIDIGNSICVDPFGNVFVTGGTSAADFPVLPAAGAYFQGVFGGGGVFQGDAFILKFSNSGVRLWATYYGGSGLDIGSSICTDALGNIFVLGETSSADLPVLNSAGSHFQGVYGGNGGSSSSFGDAFILKFSNAGVRLWATYYGVTGYDTPYSICTDPSGNIFITGSTDSNGFPVLPAAGAYFQGANAGGTDAFILKFDNAGVRLWATYYGGSGADDGYSVCADRIGNVFVLGLTDSTGFPVLSVAGAYFQGTNAGGKDAFILKFSNAGARFWATHYGGSDTESIGSLDNIAVDPCNNVYVSFETKSTDIPVQPHCGIGFYDAGFNGVQDIFIAKFNNTGACLWATYFGGNGSDYREPMAVDNFGNFFIAGEWNDPPIPPLLSNASYPLTDPGGGAYYDPTFNGEQDWFIAKFLPPVLTLTATPTSAGCNCSGTGTAAATGGCSSYYKYTWHNSGWTQIGNTQTVSNLCPGNYQVIVRDTFNCGKVDTAFITITGSGNLSLSSTQNNPVCNAQCTGSASIIPGGGILPYTYSWNTVPVQTTINVTGLCSGIYTVLLTDANGCSSSNTVTITDPAVLTASQAASICTGSTYTLPGGAAVNASGIYKDTLTSVNGCDSIITTTLNVVPPLTTSQTASICTGSTYILPGGTVVSASGIYKDTLTSVNGCDSIITTTLTVNPLSTASQASSICSGSTYTLPGGTIVSASGIYKDTLTSTNGCDSIITTTLTVVPAVTAIQSVSICTGSTYTLPGGTVVSVSGSYKDTLTAANGCDSIITTSIAVSLLPTVVISPNVTITQGITTTLTANGGANYQWSSGETTQNIDVSPLQTTTYCVTVTDVNGCTGIACVTVTTEDPCFISGVRELYLPNAFSPNGDGENDEFCLSRSTGIPSGQGGMDDCITELTITIYDRWGEEVYKSNDSAFCWDGTNKDKLQNTAVFVYYLDATFITGEQITKQGNVSLVK